MFSGLNCWTHDKKCQLSSTIRCFVQRDRERNVCHLTHIVNNSFLHGLEYTVHISFIAPDCCTEPNLNRWISCYFHSGPEYIWTVGKYFIFKNIYIFKVFIKYNANFQRMSNSFSSFGQIDSFLILREELNLAFLILDESFHCRAVEQRSVFCNQFLLLWCLGKSYLTMRSVCSLIQPT